MNAYEAVNQYKKNLALYEELTAKNLALLKEIIGSMGIKAMYEDRTKSVSSFRRKITQIDKSYPEPFEQITDLSGIRVILYSLQDVETVASVIKSEFTVDETRSVNKFDEKEVDQFGYLSQQFIVKVHERRRWLREYERIRELNAEIQVRTVLQHAWAVVDHVLIYRNKNDAPKEFRRRLVRLMALFEMADIELDNLIKERGMRIAEYRTDMAHNNLSMDINADSLKSYISFSDEVRYWHDYVRTKVGVKVESKEWHGIPQTLETLQFWGLRTIEDLDRLLLAAHGWGERLFDLLYERQLEQNKVYYKRNNLSLKDTTQSTHAAVLLLTVATNIDKIVARGLEEEYRFGSANFVQLAGEVRGIEIKCRFRIEGG
jgi:putative GTP pyrophosphokinase